MEDGGEGLGSGETLQPHSVSSAARAGTAARGIQRKTSAVFTSELPV